MCQPEHDRDQNAARRWSLWSLRALTGAKAAVNLWALKQEIKHNLAIRKVTEIVRAEA